MDKYIVEIDGKNICSDSGGKSKLALSVKADNGYAVFCTEIPLTPYTEPDLEQVRKEAYQHGLSDAWECARKIFCTSHGELERIFDLEEDDNGLLWVYHEYTASEAIEKIRQYEQEKEEQITKGDIVLIKSDPEVEILVTYADEEYVSGIALTEVDGNCEIGDQYTNIRINNVEKAGKHYDIVSVLQKMKEASDG